MCKGFSVDTQYPNLRFFVILVNPHKHYIQEHHPQKQNRL